MAYKRKTRDAYECQVDFGQGWECVSGSDYRFDALADVRAYRANDPANPARLRKVREPVAADHVEPATATRYVITQLDAYGSREWLRTLFGPHTEQSVYLTREQAQADIDQVASVNSAQTMAVVFRLPLLTREVKCDAETLRPLHCYFTNLGGR